MKNDTKPRKTSAQVELMVKLTRWWSQTMWDVVEQDEVVATLDTSSFFGTSLFQVHTDCYQLQRRGWFGDPQLVQNDNVICAAKTQKLGRSCTFPFDDREYGLVPNRFPNREYRLEADGKQCGWVRPLGVLTTRITASLPGQLPVEVRVFVIWLFLNGWLAYNTA